MSVPEELKRWMIDHDVSVVDLNWRKMDKDGVDWKEVLKWETENKHLFDEARNSRKAAEGDDSATHNRANSAKNATARKIVSALEDDFTDRRGLRQQWDMIDDEIKRDIRAEWRKIVQRHL